MTQNAPKEKHVIAASEGNAVAIATGYHLATGKHPMVYLQVFLTKIIYSPGTLSFKLVIFNPEVFSNNIYYV